MPPDEDGQKLAEKEFLATFRRDLAAFKAMLPRLLEECPGQYVAILDGHLVDHKPNWEDLVGSTKKLYPDRFVLLEQVVPTNEETVIDMDTLEG